MPPPAPGRASGRLQEGLGDGARPIGRPAAGGGGRPARAPPPRRPAAPGGRPPPRRRRRRRGGARLPLQPCRPRGAPHGACGGGGWTSEQGSHRHGTVPDCGQASGARRRTAGARAGPWTPVPSRRPSQTGRRLQGERGPADTGAALVPPGARGRGRGRGHKKTLYRNGTLTPLVAAVTPVGLATWSTRFWTGPLPVAAYCEKKPSIATIARRAF
jgi:hypothetical protein